MDDRGRSCGRWPGADLSGSSEVAHGSRVRPKHAPESPNSLSRILMRPSTFHSLHAHSLTQSVGGDGQFARGRAEVRAGERAVRYWGRRRRGRWLYRISWRHRCDVTVATSLTVPPTARPPPPPVPPARACANGTASTELSYGRAGAPPPPHAASRRRAPPAWLPAPGHGTPPPPCVKREPPPSLLTILSIQL